MCNLWLFVKTFAFTERVTRIKIHNAYLRRIIHCNWKRSTIKKSGHQIMPHYMMQYVSKITKPSQFKQDVRKSTRADKV